MNAKPEFNADPAKVVVMDTNTMPWEPYGVPGIAFKLIERIHDPRKGRETLLLRIDAGAALPEEIPAQRIDIFVVSGSFSDGDVEYARHSFVRHPPGARLAVSSRDGCTLYVKRRVPIRPTDAERFAVDSKTAKWTPFPHRGADVLHLYRDRHGIETARIGNVHPQKKIPSHDHAIGEETLVLEGLLKDEHAAYPPGTWFRFPIGVPHAPFTEDSNCLMLIREGDLVW